MCEVFFLIERTECKSVFFKYVDSLEISFYVRKML